MQIISFVLVLIEATGIACVKFCVIRLSTDEEETRWAFRKHFDHQLELYKTVVSIKYYIYLILIKRHYCNYMYMYNGIFKFQGVTCFFDLHTCNKLVKYFMIRLYQFTRSKRASSAVTLRSHQACLAITGVMGHTPS